MATLASSTTNDDDGKAERAGQHLRAGRLDRALPLLREALAAATSASASGDVDIDDGGSICAESESTLDLIANLGLCLRGLGQLDEAESLLRRAVAGRVHVSGPEHPKTLTAVSNLGGLLTDVGAPHEHEADALLRRAIAGRTEVLGANHGRTLNSVAQLALALLDRGKFEEAEQLLWRAFEGTEKMLGPDHPRTLITVRNLGWFLVVRGHLTEAEKLVSRTEVELRKLLGPDHAVYLVTSGVLGCVRMQQTRKQGVASTGQQQIESALEKLTAPPISLPDTHRWVRSFRRCLVSDLERVAAEARDPVMSPTLSARLGRLTLHSMDDKFSQFVPTF